MNIPTVETYGHATKLKLPCVGNDDAAIGRLAAKHLLERRFRNFAFSSYPDQPWAERRCRGFIEAVREAGCACEVGYYPRSFDTLRAWERARQQLTAWLKQLPKPLGLMACSDRHAQNILDACRRARIALPDEVAVIGSDNNEAICRLSDPPLSSVADDPRQIGYEAARLLDRLMSGKADPAATEPLLVPPKYVVTRRSTDISVVDDELVAEALHFIRERAFEPINVSIMLQKMSVSRSTLYRRFRNAVGRSPHEELLRIRLDRVKELLTQTSLPLTQVASLAGFEHVGYMATVFKRQAGMTPIQYRDSYRKQK